jgi:poly-gamma-glutamate synthesis protein (capsule biosynthesis protein)
VKKPWLVLALGVMMTACAPTASPVPLGLASPTIAPTSTTTGPASKTLWISSAVPAGLRHIAEGWGIPLTPDSNLASLSLDVQPGSDGGSTQWLYALVAPFPTVMDGVTYDELRAVWKGSSSESFGKWPLLMTASTLSAFANAWGAPAVRVQVTADDQLADAAWEEPPAWAIIPFESIGPRWKVLAVDGQSPIRKDFDASSYPLKVSFAISSTLKDTAAYALPKTNRDPLKLTTVIMTGTTALVREIAYQMEVKGLDYPGRDIGDILRQADILHVSDEVSFDPNCPPPNPDKNRFYCSDPRYIELFDKVGVDVVELTGNHILDNGVYSMLYTLDLYKQHHIAFFGGGANLEDARKPFMVDLHGNKLAFLGCIAGEPPEPLATSGSPGANPCDYPLLTAQVKSLRTQGYLPIVTFQYKEGYSPQVMPWQENDFRKVAEAGAVIVSGSQSHVPMEMEFYKGTFIHYGLGNLFFGQMGNQPPGPGLPLQPSERYEFLDRHVFYDGRYINTELLTAMLEDYARPRPLTPDERAGFLTAYFAYSGWLPLVPTPGPEQTPTRYPLLQFVPLPTHTPLPKATPTP